MNTIRLNLGDFNNAQLIRFSSKDGKLDFTKYKTQVCIYYDEAQNPMQMVHIEEELARARKAGPQYQYEFIIRVEKKNAKQVVVVISSDQEDYDLSRITIDKHEIGIKKD